MAKEIFIQEKNLNTHLGIQVEIGMSGFDPKKWGP